MIRNGFCFKRILTRFNITSVVLLMILLSSCSHIRRDGPPHYYVDETKVPNAVPKPERLSRLGNQPSYVVKGVRYYTMRSSKGYDKIGVASWYGTRFHDLRTSNGERYNMLSMTAAHKTLPLPTYVEVTNLRNHRKVIVKVNDRGPFRSDRIIDLSYVAAKKLGMSGRGTALVEVKAIDPYEFGRSHSMFAPRSTTYSKQSYTFASRTTTHSTHSYMLPKSTAKASLSQVWPTSNSSQLMYLQVGAFRNKAYAQALKHRLSAKIKTPVIITAPSHTNKLYRVQVGPIKDVAAANKLTRQLKMSGMTNNKWVKIPASSLSESETMNSSMQEI